MPSHERWASLPTRDTAAAQCGEWAFEFWGHRAEQAQIKQAKAGLASAVATLELARSTYQRNTALVSRGFISAAALDQSKKEVEAGEAQVQLARAQLERADADFSNSVIRSPIDGIIIKRNIDIGQTVAASFQTPDLFQVAKDLKEMQIHTSVSEADVGLLKVGQPVRFTVDAYPEREFNGTVKQFRLSPNVQQNVVTYVVLIDVHNDEELLKPGMTATSRILGETLDEAGVQVVVPRGAIQTIDGQPFVFVEKSKGKYDMRAVERGADVEGDVEILRGLAGGEPVVVDGSFILKSEILREQMGSND